MFRSLKIWRRNNGQFLRSLLVLRDTERDVIMPTRIKIRKELRIRMLKATKTAKTRRDRDKERTKEREVANPRLRTNNNKLKVLQLAKKAMITRERETNLAEIETETTTTTMPMPMPTLTPETSRPPRTRMAITNKKTRDKSLDLDPLADQTTNPKRRPRLVPTKTETDAPRATRKSMTRINLRIASNKSNKTLELIRAAKETKTTNNLLKRFTCLNV